MTEREASTIYNYKYLLPSPLEREVSNHQQSKQPFIFRPIMIYDHISYMKLSSSCVHISYSTLLECVHSFQNQEREAGISLVVMVAVSDYHGVSSLLGIALPLIVLLRLRPLPLFPTYYLLDDDGIHILFFVSLFLDMGAGEESVDPPNK